MPKLRKGQKLTPKQRVFVTKYVKNGFNGTVAAMEAYDTTDTNVAANIASENLSKPNIKETIESIMDRKGLATEDLVDELYTVATAKIEKKISANEKLRAIEVGLKLRDAFPATKHINANMNMKMYQDMDIKDLIQETKRLDSLVEDLGYK